MTMRMTHLTSSSTKRGLSVVGDNDRLFLTDEVGRKLFELYLTEVKVDSEADSVPSARAFFTLMRIDG
jgi:hypothetical protein